MANTTNFQRAEWGQAALDAVANNSKTMGVLLAYAIEKTGRQRLYDETACVRSDLLCDALHALQLNQLPETVETSLMTLEHLNLTEYQKLLACVVPESEREQQLLSAAKTWTEEQEERIEDSADEDDE